MGSLIILFFAAIIIAIVFMYAGIPQPFRWVLGVFLLLLMLLWLFGLGGLGTIHFR